jgi:hypothetical protein
MPRYKVHIDTEGGEANKLSYTPYSTFRRIVYYTGFGGQFRYFASLTSHLNTINILSEERVCSHSNTRIFKFALISFFALMLVILLLSNVTTLLLLFCNSFNTSLSPGLCFDLGSRQQSGGPESEECPMTCHRRDTVLSTENYGL